MKSTNCTPRPFAGPLAVFLTCLLMGLVGAEPAAAQQAQNVASLNQKRASSVVPGLSNAPSPGRVAEVKSLSEALVLLHKLEAQLRASSDRPVDTALLDRQAGQAGEFVRQMRFRRMQSARYQWHRISHLRPETGATRLILRPIRPVPYVSALELVVARGALRVKTIRTYGASGVVHEFHPRRVLESGKSSETSRFTLDREINLTAVEVFCDPIAREDLEVSVQGGIAVEPAPVAETWCLRALQLAQVEIRRSRFDQAARHVHNSIDLLKQGR